MAALGSITGLLVGDLLTEVDMKPWWETIRGYLYAVTVGVSLWTMETVTLSPSIDCFPSFQNGSLLSDSETATFSEPKAAYINTICLVQLPWYLLETGIMNVAFSVALLMTSSFWLHHPHVINSFKSYRRVEELLEEFLLTREEMQNKKSMMKILDDQEERLKFEKIRNYAREIEKCKYVPVLYKIRTAALNLVCVAFLATILTRQGHTWKDRDTFVCSSRPKSMKEGTFHACAHNLTLKLIPLEWILAATILGQVIISLYPLIFTLRMHHSNKIRVRRSIPARWEVGYFIECFWKNSRPVGSGSFSQFSYHLLSKKSTTRILKNICYQMHPQTLLNDIENFLKSNGTTMDLEVEYQAIIDFLDGEMAESLYFPNIEERVADILPGLVEGKYWELLVSVLDDYDGETTEEISRILSGICLHEVGWPFQYGRSILYYVLRKGSVKDQAATRILKNSRDSRPVYVHCDLLSRPAEALIETMDGKSSGRYDYLRKLILVNRNVHGVSEVDYVLPHDQLCRLTELANLYENEPEKYQAEYKIAQKQAATRVSRHRFLEWSDDMQLLAEKLFQNKQWMVFVELLNSYVPNDHGKCQECAIKNFVVDEKDSARPPFGSILYYALRKPRFRSKFVIDAALHIISSTNDCTVWNVWDEQGHRYSAEYFLTHKHGMAWQGLNEKNRLLKTMAETKMIRQKTDDNAVLEITDECHKRAPHA